MRSELLIVNGQVVLQSGVRRCSIAVADGRIAEIGDPHADGAAEAIDAAGMIVAPGFIDLQINGGLGNDFATDGAAIWRLARRLPQYGVTSFLPTIVTSPMESVSHAQEVVLQPPPDASGAIPLGLHLEGPMLSPQQAGAHSPEYLRRPTAETIEGWYPDKGVVMVTIAPELPGALDIARKLTERGITVAVGHSEATSEQAAAGLDVGIGMVTHLYNAMSPLHHRRPGLVGHALGRDDVAASIIVDGIHVDPIAVGAAWSAMGSKRIALVSDAVAAQGMPDGAYKLGREHVILCDGAVRRHDGGLAGSNLTLDQAVRNLVAFTGCDVAEAIESATATPARIIGLRSKGVLAEGYDADLVLLDDNLQVVLTIVGGQVVYEHRSLRKVL